MRRQRYFRFTRGAQWIEHIKMRNGAMTQLETAYGPPIGNHCNKWRENKKVTKKIARIQFYHTKICTHMKKQRRSRNEAKEALA